MNHFLKSFLMIIPLFLFLTSTTGAQDRKSADRVNEILEEYESWSSVRDDWANLDKYREKNRELGPPEAGEKRIVFMGNSITEGWSEGFRDFYDGKPYINRGISGQTTPQMLIRFRQDVVDLKPDVVLILAGTNDIAGNTGPSTPDMIADNIFSMSEIADANGIKVIICSILPAIEYPWKPEIKPAKIIVEVNQKLRAYAGQHGHYYLDYHSEMSDEKGGMKRGLAYDEVHPTAEGYRVMSELADEAINELLNTE